MRFVTCLFLGIMVSVSAAQAESRDDIIKSCSKDLRMSASECNCVADEAQKSFKGKQMDFFLAVISNNRHRMISAQSLITPKEMQQISDNMNRIPEACAGK